MLSQCLILNREACSFKNSCTFSYSKKCCHFYVSTVLMEMIPLEMVRDFTQLKGCKQFQNVLSTIHLHSHRTTLDHRFQNLWHVKIGHSRSQLITVLIEIFQFRFANISACHRCLTLLTSIPMLSFTTSQNLTKRLTLFHGSSTQTIGNWLLEKFDGLLWHVWCGSDSAMSCLKSLPRNSHEVIFFILRHQKNVLWFCFLKSF